MLPEPAALRKAKALERHLVGNTLGASVSLTDEEAWEFLEYLPSLLHPDAQDEYEFDLSMAKLAGNPWQMLDPTFTVLGFAITRVADLH